MFIDFSRNKIPSDKKFLVVSNKVKKLDVNFSSSKMEFYLLKAVYSLEAFLFFQIPFYVVSA